MKKLSASENKLLEEITDFTKLHRKDDNLNDLIAKKFHGENIHTGGNIWVTLVRLNKNSVLGINDESIVLYQVEVVSGMSDMDIFEDEEAIENATLIEDFSDTSMISTGEGDLLLKDEGDFYFLYGKTEKGKKWMKENNYSDPHIISEGVARQLWSKAPHLKIEEFKKGGVIDSALSFLNKKVTLQDFTI